MQLAVLHRQGEAGALVVLALKHAVHHAEPEKHAAVRAFKEAIAVAIDSHGVAAQPADVGDRRAIQQQTRHLPQAHHGHHRCGQLRRLAAYADHGHVHAVHRGLPAQLSFPINDDGNIAVVAADGAAAIRIGRLRGLEAVPRDADDDRVILTEGHKAIVAQAPGIELHAHEDDLLHRPVAQIVRPVVTGAGKGRAAAQHQQRGQQCKHSFHKPCPHPFISGA